MGSGGSRTTDSSNIGVSEGGNGSGGGGVGGGHGAVAELASSAGLDLHPQAHQATVATVVVATAVV